MWPERRMPVGHKEQTHGKLQSVRDLARPGKQQHRLLCTECPLCAGTEELCADSQ